MGDLETLYSLPKNRFNPFTLANLELALDAGKIGSVLGDGESVAQWNDLSGKGRHVTQAVGDKQPLFRNANRNLLSYSVATLEVGTATTYQPANNTPTISDEVASPIRGTKSGKMTCTANTLPFAAYVSSIPTNAIPVVPGQTLSGQMKFKAVAGRTIKCYIMIYTAALGNLQSLGGTAVVADGNVQSATTTGVVNAGGAWAFIAPYQDSIGGTVVGDSVVFDDLQIEAGGVATPWVAPVTLPNNQPTVQFDGIDDTLETVISSALQVGANGLSVYTVRNNDAISGVSTRAVVATIAGTSGWMHGTVNIAKMKGYAYNIAGVPIEVTSGMAPTVSTFDVASSVLAPTAVGSAVNGSSLTTAAIANYAISAGPLTIGSSENAASRYLIGSIAAVLVFSEAHSDSTRKRIEKWLGKKYGIAVA